MKNYAFILVSFLCVNNKVLKNFFLDNEIFECYSPDFISLLSPVLFTLRVCVMGMTGDTYVAVKQNQLTRFIVLHFPSRSLVHLQCTCEYCTIEIHFFK